MYTPLFVILSSDWLILVILACDWRVTQWPDNIVVTAHKASKWLSAGHQSLHSGKAPLYLSVINIYHGVIVARSSPPELWVR